MQQASYAGRFGISQSMLKDWEKMSPAKWKRVWVDRAEKDEREDYFDAGSLVDCLAFTPERLGENFVITDMGVQLPSEQIKKIIEKVYELHTNMEKVKAQTSLIVFGTAELKDYDNELFELSKQPDINYGKGKYPKERVVKEVLEKGQKYFDTLCEVGGKTIISFEDNVKALEQVEILRTHPVSRPYFVQQEGEQLIFQHELFIPLKEYDHLPFFRNNNINGSTLVKKCAFDIIRIDHIRRTIQNADLKTSFDAHKHNFMRSIKKFRYGTQVSYYDVMLGQWRDDNFPGYKIIPPVNIAIDCFLKKPQVYRYKTEDLELLRFGGVDNKGEMVKGWEETLTEVLWHIENNIWDNSREMEEHGFIEVQLF